MSSKQNLGGAAESLSKLLEKHWDGLPADQSAKRIAAFKAVASKVLDNHARLQEPAETPQMRRPARKRA
jgi:hypothetical protein